jgi:Zn-finger nucleic acid-binding protein
MLHTAQAGAIPVHGCGGCGGVWLDNEASSRVIAKINPDVVSLAQQAGVRAQTRADEQQPSACPACSKPLRRGARG